MHGQRHGRGEEERHRLSTRPAGGREPGGVPGALEERPRPDCRGEPRRPRDREVHAAAQRGLEMLPWDSEGPLMQFHSRKKSLQGRKTF